MTAHFSHLSSLSLPLPLPCKAAEQGCCRILALAGPAPDLQPCWGRHRPGLPASPGYYGRRQGAQDRGTGEGGSEGEPPGRLGPGDLLSGQARQKWAGALLVPLPGAAQRFRGRIGCWRVSLPRHPSHSSSPCCRG